MKLRFEACGECGAITTVTVDDGVPVIDNAIAHREWHKGLVDKIEDRMRARLQAQAMTGPGPATWTGLAGP